MSLREEILKAITFKCFSEMAAERATYDLLSIFKRHIEDALDKSFVAGRSKQTFESFKSEYLKSKGIK